MTNWTVSEFKEKILKGQNIPSDLEMIIQNQSCLDMLQGQLEFELIEEGRIEEEMACTYISDEERKSNGIQAAMFATNKVFEHITFFAEAENGMLLGYWHGEEGLDILEAPLVGFDTEAEFELLEGNKIIEALAMKWTCEDEEEYEGIQKLFSECGVQVDPIESIAGIKTKSQPSDMHDKLYASKKEELRN